MVKVTSQYLISDLYQEDENGRNKSILNLVGQCTKLLSQPTNLESTSKGLDLTEILLTGTLKPQTKTKQTSGESGGSVVERRTPDERSGV